MTPRKHEVASLSGAYALHALSDEEVTLFEAHLADSEELRNEVTELTDTAVLLGLATPPVAPPAALKASIMAQLASTPQLPREVEPETSVDVRRFSGNAEAKARSRWFAKPITALVGMAAAIALIVGGVAAANTMADHTFQQAQADQLAAINAAEDSQRQVAEVSTGGTVTLMWSGALASAALIVDDLEPLPSDRVYELWYIDESGARPAGVFTVDDDGSTWRVLDGEMAAGDTVGVTVEPAGGSDSPTTAPIVEIASA